MAGLEPIRRPFDNMRASRSNEIYATFGPFYESQWLGHSTRIAHDHYLTVTPDDILRGAEWTTEEPDSSEPDAPIDEN